MGAAIVVTDEAVSRYYLQHKAQFIRPRKVLGRLISFNDINAAHIFLRDPNTVVETSPSVISEETLVFTRESLLPGLDLLPQLVFAAFSERALGPFRRGSAFVVWVKIKDIETEELPLSSVRTSTRREMEDKRLPSLELQRAREIAPDFQIIDRIDYRIYGVGNNLLKPWKG